MCFPNGCVSVAWRAVVLVCLASVLGCGAGTARPATPKLEVSVATLYPLRVGAAWSYDVDSGDGEMLLATTRVLRVQDGLAEVSSGQASLRYRLRPDGLERGEPGGYLLKPPFAQNASWASGPDSVARIVALDQFVATAAGSFGQCVVVEEHNAGSGQTVTTTYCPGVGPARVVSQMQVRGHPLRVTATLRGFATDVQ
jgi:hypothetical protein